MSARVLVIEDNDANLELMTYLLTAFGHTTAAARDGEEGIALASRGEFDIVICDIQLPKRDGYEVAREVRSRIGKESLPLLAVTAFAQVGDREKALAAGFDGYISKPIVPESFVSQVEAFLRPDHRSVYRPLSQAATTANDAAPARARSATILVVDNEGTNVQLMRSLLEPFGYRVAAATGVAAALQYLSENVPDLIVSDLHLLDGTGYDLLGGVKESSRHAAVPFIFLSSSARGVAERERGLSLGAHRFIVRPIDAPVLLAAIEECLPPR